MVGRRNFLLGRAYFSEAILASGSVGISKRTSGFIQNMPCLIGPCITLAKFTTSPAKDIQPTTILPNKIAKMMTDSPHKKQNCRFLNYPSSDHHGSMKNL